MFGEKNTNFPTMRNIVISKVIEFIIIILGLLYTILEPCFWRENFKQIELKSVRTATRQLKHLNDKGV